MRSGSLGAIGAVDVSDNAHSGTFFFSLSFHRFDAFSHDRGEERSTGSWVLMPMSSQFDGAWDRLGEWTTSGQVQNDLRPSASAVRNARCCRCIRLANMRDPHLKIAQPLMLKREHERGSERVRLRSQGRVLDV